MDNQNTQTPDNVQTQNQNQETEGQGAPVAQVTQDVSPQEGFSWKNKIGPDLANSPTMGKFDDNEEGFMEAVKSHVKLEKLLGNEKIPVPQGDDDAEGWERVYKALGVPETAADYELADPEFSKDLEGLSFDKNSFSEIAREHNLTPKQAQGLWNKYTEMMGNTYTDHVKQYQETLNKNINALRQEWGEAYDSKIELGQMVIDKFAGDNKEMADYLTSTMSKNPNGMKFLAEIGNQFQENKIGEFQYKQYSNSPEEAQRELDRIYSNPAHAYNNENAPKGEHESAVEHVNRLIAATMKGKTR